MNKEVKNFLRLIFYGSLIIFIWVEWTINMPSYFDSRLRGKATSEIHNLMEIAHTMEIKNSKKLEEIGWNEEGLKDPFGKEKIKLINLNGKYFLLSLGPDRIYDSIDAKSVDDLIFYDPSNGTNSKGDILIPIK